MGVGVEPGVLHGDGALGGQCLGEGDFGILKNTHPVLVHEEGKAKGLPLGGEGQDEHREAIELVHQALFFGRYIAPFHV